MIVGVLGAVLVSIGAVPAALAPSPPPRPSLAVAPAEESIRVPEPDAAGPSMTEEAEDVGAEPDVTVDSSAGSDASDPERDLAYPLSGKAPGESQEPEGERE